MSTGQRMHCNAEENEGFSDEQGGSRPGQGSIDVVMFKKLTYRLSEMTKTTLGTFDNDAQACYDRIVISLAMLASRKLEMPQNAVKLHATFLQQAQYHLKQNWAYPTNSTAI
jgi:hypothetical protein